MLKELNVKIKYHDEKEKSKNSINCKTVKKRVNSYKSPKSIELNKDHILNTINCSINNTVEFYLKDFLINNTERNQADVLPLKNKGKCSKLKRNDRFNIEKVELARTKNINIFENFEKEKQSKKENISKLELNIENIKNKIFLIKKELDNTLNNNLVLNKDSVKIIGQNNFIQHEKVHIVKEISNLKVDIDELKFELKKINDQNQFLTLNSFKTETEISFINEDIKKVGILIEEITNENKEISIFISNIRKKITSLKTDILEKSLKINSSKLNYDILNKVK